MNDHIKLRIDRLIESSGQSPAGTAQLAYLLAYNAILQEEILAQLQLGPKYPAQGVVYP